MKNVSILQYLATVTATLNVLCHGMHFGWSSPSLPILLQPNSTIPITNDDGSWLIVIGSGGTLCGSLMSLVILGMFGSKNIVLLSCLPYFIAWIMIAYAKSIGVLLAARFIAGVSQGFIYCALPMYLGEISHPRIRGLLSSSISFMRTLGTLLINIIGAHLTIKTTALVSSVVPVLCLITFFWMPESPYYFIKKGDYDKARKSLRALNGKEDVEPEMERIMQAVRDLNKENGSWWDLFKDEYNRKALIISGGARTAQQLCGNGAITFYAQTIFKEAQSVISSSTATCIYFTIELLFCGCSSLLVDKAGRKPLMIISIIGSGLALFTEGVYFYILKFTDINTATFSWLPIAALIFFIIIFSAGMQFIPKIFVGELFAPDVKASAICVVDIFCVVGIMVTSKCFQITKDAYGLHVPFFSFSFCCLLGLLFIIFVVPETKGKTLEDIQLELRGKKTAEKDEPPVTFKIIADRY